jgi:hypothetical protein
VQKQVCTAIFKALVRLLWKLDGLPEYDIRRPLTPTGTNLLGLVKHLGGVEAGYFGDTFGRPFGERFRPVSKKRLSPTRSSGLPQLRRASRSSVFTARHA